MAKQQKILVVDDEPINIDVLGGLLKQDYRLIVAKNGERALKAALSGNPDLILLDIMMPDMDGYEVCRRLKADESTRDIPVIFITAMNQTDDEALGFELGAADYITKPVSPPILRARVKTQLALVQNRKQLQAAYATTKTQKDRKESELNIGRDIPGHNLKDECSDRTEDPQSHRPSDQNGHRLDTGKKSGCYSHTER